MPKWTRIVRYPIGLVWWVAMVVVFFFVLMPFAFILCRSDDIDRIIDANMRGWNWWMQ